MFKAVHEISACTDCLLYVANGDVPYDNSDGWSESAIYSRWPTDQFDLACGDNEHNDEFSWQPCECCGSRLGGSRHSLVALERK